MSDTINDMMNSIPGSAADDASTPEADSSTASRESTGGDAGGEDASTGDGAGTSTSTPARSGEVAANQGQEGGAGKDVQVRQGSTSPGGAPQGRVVNLANGLQIRPNPENPRLTQLYDPKTGQVLANNPVEVRNYKTLQEESVRNQHEIATLRAQVGAYEQATSHARELGLTPEHQVTAVRIMGDFLKDPIGTLGQLVAEMQAAGHELPFMQQAGVSPKVLEQMLDKRLAPLQAPVVAEQQRAEQDRAAQVELDKFLMNHQDAGQNLPFIGYIIEKGGAQTYDAAYITMLKWCAEHKFDPTQPLEPQIDARKAAGTNPTGTTPETSTANRLALPNGRNALDVGVQQTTEAAHTDGLYSESMSWEDIVRDGMRRAGMSV